MLASLLGVLSLSALPAANAFPRWQRQARQVDAQAQASLLSCPAPVTSFVPIITTIPECTEGNACATNTIISQGQPYITSTLVSSTATGAPGDVLGGTTVVNNGASASNVAFPAATVCTADCVLGGVTYTSGTVFYSTSAVASPSATVVVGGSTLTGTTAPITSASAVTLTYFSTIINNVPVTDGSQPLTTITDGPDGVTTTIIQPASQVITSLQNSATPGLPTGAPDSNVITVIVPGPSGPVTQIETTGPGGVPTTIFPPITSPGGNGDAPATTPVIPPVTLPGGNGDGPVTTPVIPPVTTPGSNGDGPATTPIVPPVTNPGSTPVISAGPSTNVLPTSSIDVIGNPGNNAGTLTSVAATSAADDQDATSTIVDAPSTSSGALAESTSSTASDVASSSVTGAPSTTSETLPATTSSVGQTCFTDSDCDGIILGICVKAAGALATDIGVCVDGTPNTASSTISGTSTIDAGASSSTSASTLPTGGPGIFPVATCTEDSDCFLGVCLQAGLTPLLGTGLGVCLGSSTNPGLTPSSTAGVPLPTQSVIPGTGASGSCTSDSDCLIGICLDATLAPVLGLGTGICLGNNPGLGANPTTGGNGATSTLSSAPTGNTSPVVASCDATTTCAVGVCLGANLLPITGAGVGICLGQNTDSTTPIDPSTGSTPATVSCGSTQDCLIGLCLNLGILGGNVCVGSSSSLVNPSVSASLGLPSITGLPTISVDLPGATGLPTISADLPGVTGLPGLPTGAVPCTATQGCLVGVCAQIGLFNLGTDVGICVGSTGSSSGLVDATISADLPGLTGLPTTSADLPGATGLPGLPVGAVQCSATQGCLVGVCAQIGAFNLGSDIGICVGSTGSSSGLVDATISVDVPGATGLPGLPIGAVQCSATQGCLVGVCAQIGAFNLGSDIGICVGSTGSSTGLVGATITADIPVPTLDPTLPGIPTGASSCSATDACAVGICAQLGAFNLGTGVGVCVDPTSQEIITASVSAGLDTGAQPTLSVPSVTVSDVLATQTGTTCGPNVPCAIGACVNVGLLGLGADVGLCVLEGVDPLVTASVGATVLPNPATLPAVPAPTVAASASVDVGVTVAPPSPTVAPAPSTLVTSIAPAATIAGRRRCTTSADCTGLGLAAVCVNGLDIIGVDVNICA